MGLLGAFTTRSDGQTITAAIWNNDFTQVRDWANTYAVIKDVSATITAVHTFSAVPVFSAGFTSSAASTVATKLGVSGGSPILQLIESDQSADEQKWQLVSVGKTFTFRSADAAETGVANILTATRGTGTAITAIGLGAETTVTGGVIAGAFTLNAVGTFSGGGRFYKDATYGSVVAGISGSTSDCVMTDNGGTPRVRVDAGGSVYLNGATTVNGAITPTSIAGNVSFSGTPTFGSLSASGTATIGTAAITTLSGNPNFSGTPTLGSYSASGTASLTTLTVSGVATFDGNVTFGNATTDTVTVNADTITLNSQPVIVAGDNAGGNIFRLQNATASGNYIAITDPNGDGLTSVKISIGGTFPAGGADILLGQVSKNTTDTTGFPFLPYVAGAPTGVPTNGTGALVVDTSNLRLYVRVGASWRYATLT